VTDAALGFNWQIGGGVPSRKTPFSAARASENAPPRLPAGVETPPPLWGVIFREELELKAINWLEGESPDALMKSHGYKEGDVLPIPEGHKAVGLRVQMDTTISGFASLPGSHVDILQTVHRPGIGSYTQVLIENVRVLAADQQPDRQGTNLPGEVLVF